MRKKTVLLALFFTIVLDRAAAALDAAKEPPGFRGLLWGTSLSALPDKDEFVRIAQDKARKFYARHHDDLNLGGVPLKSIYLRCIYRRRHTLRRRKEFRTTLSSVGDPLRNLRPSAFQPVLRSRDLAFRERRNRFLLRPGLSGRHLELYDQKAFSEQPTCAAPHAPERNGVR